MRTVFGVAETGAINMIRVHEMPFGTTILNDGLVRFRLWAPAAHHVQLCLESHMAADILLAMEQLADGWFQLETAQAALGAFYYYCIDGGLRVPDPASRANPIDVQGPSQVLDPGVFDWLDTDWHGRPWTEAVIYELHVGTFTAEGRFTSAMQHLDYLVDLGITAIELMPVADFSGKRNWGYDGVLLFAPDASYGTPDELKGLVQAAHARGLMVILDVVYNHFGPEGNFLHHYAPQFFNEQQHTPWGAAINFSGDDSRIVRDFYIHNALYWLEEYHFDGLRFDAVHAIIDDSQPNILQEIAATVHTSLGNNRQIHLLLENDANEAHYLQTGGFTAQWNDDIHHSIHVLLTGETEGYYADYADQPIRYLARCLAEGFAFQGQPSAFRHGRSRGEPSRDLTSSAFINFSQTHDQIGNRAFGERIGMLSSQQRLQAGLAVLLLAPAPPMLFMGEEFAALTPFQFFCDFHGDLAVAVTEGRRREFAAFSAFADPSALAKIPDPNELATFLVSKLHWACLELPQHQDSLEYYKRLLAIRRTYIMPRLPAQGSSGVFELLGCAGIRVCWRLNDGSRLTLLANMGNETVKATIQLVGNVLYQSHVDLQISFAGGSMPAWSVAWILEEALV